jgi:hypothetical protein
VTNNLTILDADVIINVVEINDQHGVGILLQRIFKDRSRIISIRTLNLYGGEQSFGSYDLLIGAGLSRAEIFTKVQAALSGSTVRRILCIPYQIEEALIALAVREISGAEICTYLMDDQNVLTTGISDEVMSELLAQSALCLAISPEMRDVYQAKYKVPIYFAPPVVPAVLVDSVPISVPLTSGQTQVGTIFGNIWSSSWLKLLRIMTKGAGIQLDWYGNTGADWYFSDRKKLSNDGIVEKGFLPTEAEIVTVLRNYTYVVVPSGTLDLRDNNLATSWLSLPSRIPFLLATANTPMIVLGSPSTAAARFVERFGVGTVADYDPVSFRAAVTYITQPLVQQRMRENAVKIAHQFVNEQMDEWIWQSLALGKPVDDRFEAMLSDSLDYLMAFTTCLNIIREQQVEIERNRVTARLKALLIRYLQKDPSRLEKLRRIWLQLRGQI